MKKHRGLNVLGGLWACVLAAALAWHLSAQPSAGEDVKLDKRYFNALYGFSFCPPAGAERKHGLSRRRLVTWNGRDEKTGAIAWTLIVRHVVEQGTAKLDLDRYKDALAKKLQTEENFKIEMKKVFPLAGKPAIDLRGMSGGELRLWQRQVWVQTQPRHFLILTISGPGTMKERLGAILQAVLGTLKVTDPTAAREQRRKNLRRGQELLDGVTDREMASAVRRTPLWCLLKMKDKHVGFVKFTEKACSREGTEGYAVTMWTMLQLPKIPVRLVRRELFTTADRSLERWREQWQSGEGPTARNGAEDGMKQEGMIVCNLDVEGRIITHKPQKVPEHIYLPRAMAVMLPRLVDLKKPASYSFATYSTYGNKLNMRTFTVVGPQKVKTVTGTVDAVRILDKPSEDAEAATLWVTPQGGLIRMIAAGGLAMEASTRAAVMRRHPKAEIIVAALDGKVPARPIRKPSKK